MTINDLTNDLLDAVNKGLASMNDEVLIDDISDFDILVVNLKDTNKVILKRKVNDE